MRAFIPKPRSASGKSGLLWDLLTFDRLMTGPVIHLIYWCGLGLVVLFGFTVIGAAIGVAIRDGSLEGLLLAIPVLVGGVLVMAALVLLWRGACEFYMAVFRIADNLSVLRAVAEQEYLAPASEAPRAAPQPQAPAQPQAQAQPAPPVQSPPRPPV